MRRPVYAPESGSQMGFLKKFQLAKIEPSRIEVKIELLLLVSNTKINIAIKKNIEINIELLLLILNFIYSKKNSFFCQKK